MGKKQDSLNIQFVSDFFHKVLRPGLAAFTHNRLMVARIVWPTAGTVAAIMHNTLEVAHPL